MSWIPGLSEDSLNVLQELHRAIAPSNPYQFLALGSSEFMDGERLQAISRDEACDYGAGAIPRLLWGSVPEARPRHLALLCPLPILMQLRTGLVLNLNPFEVPFLSF